MSTPKIEVTTPLGTVENPYTSATYRVEECGYKHCRCSDCNEVGLCTPNNDYILCDADNLLRCPDCFRNFLTNLGVQRFAEEVVPEHNN